MVQKCLIRSIQAQTFWRRCVRRGLRWLLSVGAVVLLIQPGPRLLGKPMSEPLASVNTDQMSGPPWQMGSAEGRFVLTLYADLECPFCRKYFPLLARWVANNTDVRLQWRHLPLAAHEPAASSEARLVECAAEAGGHEAFWQAIEWVFAHTRSDGQGLPDDLPYPESTTAIEQCLASDRPDMVIRTQAMEAVRRGVSATPSLHLRDSQTGQDLLLQGPIEDDALLSAIDMLVAEQSAITSATEMPADDVGDMPR